MTARTIEITADILSLSESGKSVKIFDGADYVWIPTSQIEGFHPDMIGKRTVEIVIPEWLAHEKGLI